jgi:hypothetical protein
VKKDLSSILNNLEKSFEIIDYDESGSQILKSNSTIDVNELFFPLCENEEERDQILCDDGIFEELGVASFILLGFEYQSAGPMVFYHSLVRRDFGGENYYIQQYLDEQDPTLIAALSKNGYANLIKVFVQKYYESNGLNYSDHEMFWSLPTTTYIHDPNIDIELQKKCYRIFLDKILGRYPDHPSWFGEKEEMLSVLEEPNIIKRSMKTLEQIPKLENISEYLQQLDSLRERELESIDDREKEIILTLLIYYKTDFMILDQTDLGQ